MLALTSPLDWATTAGFTVLGAFAVARWLRGRSRREAAVALVLTLLAGTSIFSRAAATFPGAAQLLTTVSILLFELSGIGLLFLRDSFLPIPMRALRAALVSISISVALFAVVGVAPTGTTPNPAQLVAVAGLVLVWGACVGEPMVRLWMASRSRPTVQRARLRALSTGYATMFVILILAATPPAIAQSASARWALSVLQFLVVPLLYVSFAPPWWVRRMWRHREDEAARQAIDGLLTFTSHPAALASIALDHATRLVGADAGAVVTEDGDVLATAGMDAAAAAELCSEVGAGGAARMVRLPDGGNVVVIPLPSSDAVATLLVRSGPFTPLFGSDEVTRLRDYGSSLALAFDRVRQSMRYRSFLQAVSDIGEGLVITEAGRPVYVNDAYVALTGYTVEELMAMPTLLDLAPPEMRGDLTERLNRRLRGGDVPVQYLSELVRKDGQRVHVENAVRLMEGDGRSRIVAVVRDVTERRSAELALRESMERLATLASTDPLTGLRNRRDFERQIASLVERTFAILAIDVDNLKMVNDEYGHEGGDAVLLGVSRTLAALLRVYDSIARVGGDEFAVLLLDTEGDEPRLAAERMRVAVQAISSPYGQARISIGWATGAPGSDPHEVWRRADADLYNAKRAGRDRVGTGNAEERRGAPRRSTWSDLVERSLEESGVKVLFQPIVRLANGAVVGHEALARPDGCGPTDSVERFFAEALRLGRIRDVDWMCRRAAIETVAWPQDPEWSLFVNVRTVALLDPVHDVDQMLMLLASAGGRPDQVVLEITEHEIIADLRRLSRVLASYREQGFRFALDDVGEGHSTLELLAAADAEFIKIAHSLTNSWAVPGARSAIRAAVAFAQSSGAAVLAEGIEDPEVAACMAEFGIELGQGWYLGVPGELPAARPGAERPCA